VDENVAIAFFFFIHLLHPRRPQDNSRGIALDSRLRGNGAKRN
jgi:hypothetical protein